MPPDRLNLLRPLAQVLALIAATEASAGWTLRQQSIVHDPVTADGILVADFDGDGRDDALALSRQSFFVVGCDVAETCAVKQALVTEEAPYFARGVLARTSTGPSVLLATSTGFIEYAGWPLSVVREATVTRGDRWLIGDLDADGDDEFLVKEGQLLAYELATMQPLWSSAHTGSGPILAQLDADAALELVFGGFGSSAVVDGATLGVEWSPVVDFSWPVASGNLGQHGAGFVATVSGELVAYRGEPYAQVWNRPLASLNAASISDLDADGVDEILLSESNLPLQIIDAADGSLEETVSGTTRASAVAAAGLDGDAGAEIVTAHEGLGQNGWMVKVLDGVDRSTRFERRSGFGNLSRLARGDVDADGREEWVVTTAIQGGSAKILDPASGALEWQSPIPQSTGDLFYRTFVDVELLQLDEDSSLEVVLVGAEGSDRGRIFVLDGTTREIELLIDAGVVADEFPLQAHAIDVAGDSLPELVLVSRDNSGVFLHVVSLFDGRDLWRSPSWGFEWGDHWRIMPVQTDQDPALELVVATSEGLRAIDVATRTLDWRFDAPLTASAYRTMPDGDAEFLVAQGDELVRLDASTRQERGRMDLDFSLVAVEVPPGASNWVVVASDDRLHHVNLASGEVLGTSSRLGTGLAENGQFAMASAARGFSVLAGSDIGHFELYLPDPDGVFWSGFE